MIKANIEIITSTTKETIDITSIRKLLDVSETDLSHGTEFTGKPTTSLHVNDEFVLKKQVSLRFGTKKIALSWAEKRVQKEAKTGLYHPKKTWFIVEENEDWLVSSISIRLVPLHVAIEDTSFSKLEKLAFLTNLTDLYLSTAATNDERLDEGLSNFGVDKDLKIYYLDDDFYSWDHLLSFTGMIAVWVRKFADQWFDNEIASVFGESLKAQLVKYFNHHEGYDYPGILNEHLLMQFYNGQAYERVEIISKILLRNVPVQTNDDSDSLKAPAFSTTTKDIKQWWEEDEPIAMIADIHANLPALDAVLDDIKSKNIKRIICLGDIVGYGPHPVECIERIQEQSIFTIRGNHDHMIGTDHIIQHFSDSGKFVANWTTQKINALQRQWLATLPLQLRGEHWMVVHGAPRDPTFFNAYVYDRTSDSNLKWMQDHNLKVCLHGHSHLQGFYQINQNKTSFHKELATYQLKGNVATLICPGSVGQPRSGVTGAEYAILNPIKHELELCRLDYDVELVTKAMQSNNFPDQLSRRLLQGY